MDALFGRMGFASVQCCLFDWYLAYPINTTGRFYFANNLFDVHVTNAGAGHDLPTGVTDALGGHTSWMGNFPWTRLADVVLPTEQKLPPNRAGKARLMGRGMRAVYGDGNNGGYYARPDAEMFAIWEIAVAETRASLPRGGVLFRALRTISN